MSDLPGTTSSSAPEGLRPSEALSEPEADFLYRLVQMPREEYEMAAFAGEGPMPITWLTKVVDQLQRKGWDYYDTITSTRVVRPGCIGSLLGVQKSAPTDRILVFRRRRRSRSEPGSS